MVSFMVYFNANLYVDMKSAGENSFKKKNVELDKVAG